jgi:hypothetical protein
MRRGLPDFKAIAARQQAELGEAGILRLLEASRAWELAPALREGGAVIFPHASLQPWRHDTTAAYNQPSPTWVACALIELRRPGSARLTAPASSLPAAHSSRIPSEPAVRSARP